MLVSIALCVAAAAAEIAGCFAVWSWWRSGASAWWLVAGAVLLALFAFLLALVPSAAAGRTFAAYGGLYVAASIGWLMLVEGRRPDGFDLAGAACCVSGAAIILAGHLR
jgi:small multidrug resistance family-3 protein